MINNQPSSLPITKPNIVQAFNHIHNPESSPQLRKQADQYLIQSQTQNTFVYLLQLLLEIYEDSSYVAVPDIPEHSDQIPSFAKYQQHHQKKLEQQKITQIEQYIQERMIFYVSQLTLSDNNNSSQYRILIPSLYQIVRFIAKSDFPHAFNQFAQYTLAYLENINLNEEYIRNLKEIREIFVELASKKGFVSRRAFEDRLRTIRNTIGMLGEKLRQQITNNLNKAMVKISKYCDQILICIVRITPYELLDDQDSLSIGNHLIQKLQSLLTLHNSNISVLEKAILQKNIKAIFYQMGCLQTANPCFFGPILTDYIQTLFYVVSNPSNFAKTTTLKYALLGMRKLIKQFTFYSDTSLFLKSVSSNPKSQNYIQLRQACHKAYYQFLTPQTVEGLFNFLLTNIMNIKSKEDQSFSIGFEENSLYQKSAEKQLTVHTCGTFLIQTLIQRFTDQMINLIYQLIKTCFNSNWANLSIPIQQNFFSAIAVLPRSLRSNKLMELNQFPILQILQYVHSNISLKTKLPELVAGWLMVFTNDQINSLVTVLIQFISSPDNRKNDNNQLLLYSCYSLNKIIIHKSSSIDIAYILYQLFPISIQIFTETDNPEILWPLINLISTLITKCQFDSNLIISSLQNNALNTLISSDSFMLIDALSEMLKNFLCIIPRNRPAQAVFIIIYHFLNHNLKKSEETLHQKLITLWYYAIREFSAANHCNQQYLQLFENHYRRCLFRKSPTLIYILEEYMLLGLIDNKIEDYMEVVLNFYKEANQLEEQAIEQSKNLKIAALSFEITLITKYNLNQVNNQQMLRIILEDLCGPIQKHNNPPKNISVTLQNSLLSIINRYIIFNKDLLFGYIGNIGMPAQYFLEEYFRNMQYLTSRTATRLNSIALITMIPFITSTQTFRHKYLIPLLNLVIPEIEQQVKNPQSMSMIKNNVENSPIYRFSVSVLSERKQQVRKQTTYLTVNLKQMFLKQFMLVTTNCGGPIDLGMVMNGLGEQMAIKLRFLCGM